MTLNDTTSLAIAELVIYFLLLPLIVYCLIKHGKRGIEAYFYLTTFAILRIVPAAMIISEHNKKQPESLVAAIIDAIGLSPLLLCSGGVLSEIIYYLHDGKNLKTKLGAHLLVHGGTIAGVTLAAYAASQFFGTGLTSDQISTYRHMQEAGAILLFLVWVFLVFSAARLFREVRSSASPSMFALYLAISFALLPIGARAVYSLVYAFDHNTELSPFYGKFVYKLVLVFLLQLIAALAIATGAIFSRNIVEEHKSHHFVSQ